MCLLAFEALDGLFFCDNTGVYADRVCGCKREGLRVGVVVSVTHDAFRGTPTPTLTLSLISAKSHLILGKGHELSIFCSDSVGG